MTVWSNNYGTFRSEMHVYQYVAAVEYKSLPRKEQKQFSASLRRFMVCIMLWWQLDISKTASILTPFNSALYAFSPFLRLVDITFFAANICNQDVWTHLRDPSLQYFGLEGLPVSISETKFELLALIHTWHNTETTQNKMITGAWICNRMIMYLRSLHSHFNLYVLIPKLQRRNSMKSPAVAPL